MTENFYTHNEYFASANGYSGFKSYFPQIFNSANFEKIYILKGGPGTGKSSIIKKVCSFCKMNKLYYEIYRCSSDPDSLDGIIINHCNIKVAILDGTAPHQRDAEIPGAVDELVNLGDAWNESILKSHRDKILELNYNKSKCYAKSYECLRYSSIFATNIKAEIINSFDFKKASEDCDNVINKLSINKTGTSDIKLISSFSKYGYKTLSGPFVNSEINYSIFGRFGSDKIFIGILIKKLIEMGVDFCNIPSPLDADISEGLLLDRGKTIVFGMGNGEIIFDTTSLLKINDIAQFENKIQMLEKSKEYYMRLAKEELDLASKYHFMLEDIYTPAMNFDVVEKICSKILSEIKNIYLT